MIEEKKNNMKYSEYAQVLEKLGYVPMGRYEHVFKKDSTPVMYLWYLPKKQESLCVFVHTNELGDPTTISETVPNKDPERQAETLYLGG